jgi:hypothetical protein
VDLSAKAVGSAGSGKAPAHRAAPKTARAGCRLDHLRTVRHLLAQQIQGTICTELSNVYRIESDFKVTGAPAFDAMIARAGGVPPALST